MKKIKILYTIQYFYYGGAEISLYDICKHINKDRFDVTVITLLKGDSFEVVFKKNPNINIINFDYNSRYHPLIIPRLIKHFLTIKPDITHSNMIIADIYTRLAGLFSKSKKICTLHASVLKKNIFYKIDRITARFNTMLIANSEWTKSFYTKNKYSSESKIVVIPLGVNFNKLNQPLISKNEFFSRYNLPMNAKIISFIGSFKAEKGHMLLLQSIKKLIETNPEYIFFFAGKGVLLDYYKNKAEELQVNYNIIFMGNVDNVSELLSFSDLFVSPSLAESQGIALIEAMYFKVPVIAFNVDAVPEIVINNTTGFLVDLHDVKNKDKLIERFINKDFSVEEIDINNLVDKIREVMQLMNTNESILVRIVDNAYNFVVEKYTINNTVSRLEEYYDTLLSVGTQLATSNSKGNI